MTKQDNSKPQASVAPLDIAAPSQALGPAPLSGPAAPTTGDATETPPEQQSRDGLILVSILIVSAAIAMMCFAQIGLSLPVSLATGAVVLALSMLVHKQVQKSAQIAQLKAELAQTRHDAKPNEVKAKAAPARPTAAATVSPVPGPPVAPVSSTPEARIRELSRDIGNLVPRPEAASPAQPVSAPQPQQKPVAADHPTARPLASADIMSGADKSGRPAPRAFMQPAGQPFLEVPVKAPLTPPSEAKDRPTFSAPVADRPAPEAGRERWSFRRRVDAQPQQPQAKGLTPPPSWSPAIDATLPSNTAMTIEGDLELVQRKIKELADEVNAAEAMRAPKPVRGNDRAKSPSSALEDSIGALRAVANTMRQRPSFGDFVPALDTAASKPMSAPATTPAPAPAATSAPAPAPAPTPAPAFVPPAATEPSPAPSQGLGELIIPATAERIAGFEPEEELSAEEGFEEPSFEEPARVKAEEALPLPELTLPELPILEFAAEAAPTPELPPRAAAIARAIEDEMLDVMLGPIVTLAEHSVGHYEMTTNLRSPGGDVLELNEDDFALIGELDSRFDIERLNRAAALAARMDARDRGGLLLTNFLGSSVTSRAFLESFAHTYEARPRIAAQLVLTFSQHSLDSLTPAAWQALRDMNSFGFRFALDQVEHMGTDFATLQQTGFQFVRVAAQTLLSGMTARDRFVPADEILQRATLAGLSVIASGITDAATQKRLLEAGVLLGQGPLFGAPRQVNVNGGGAPANHSAAA
ncbi:EAL domain-containing protein [Hyphomicrobium sp. 99]|uniref:EAL domain-containing protein n=1 Tax=Hyphomicrobium sp. 99 TaxID=1163419 RepID=UPI0005F79097|nr:EAL domain-containing protein [Hyphomicrobium sp. 99]